MEGAVADCVGQCRGDFHYGLHLSELVKGQGGDYYEVSGLDKDDHLL